MLYHNELLQEMKGLINRAKKRNALGKGKKRGGKTMPIAALPAFPGLQTLENRLLLSSNTFGHTDAEHAFTGINLSIGDGGVISVLDNADDDATASIDLGSDTFTFYGTQYTGAGQLFVSDNGLITFGSGNTSSSNTNLASGVTQAAIAPMWDDWTTAANENDQVLAKVEDVNGDGINDRLIIEWSDVVRPNGGGAVTFQAILRLNTGSNEGDIVFNYVDSTTGTAFANGGGATVGIKDADAAEDGRDALLISQNTGNPTLLGDGQAMRVATTALDTTAPTVEITDISPDPRNSAVSSVTFTFDGPVVGFDVADLNLTHNGGDNLLTGSETLESNDGGTTWTLSGIAGLTGGDGGYSLTLNAQGSKIVDSQLNAISDGGSDEWTVDTVAPTVAITAVTPDPISGSVDEITITFSKPIVGGFTAADLTLTRDGGPNLLDGSETLQSNDGGTTWVLGNLAGFTGTDGAYVLTLTANASSIVDNAGNEVDGDAEEGFTVDTTAPDAPTIDLISDDDSGEEDDDNETNVTLPQVTGTSEANAEIEVFVGGVSVGTTDADQNGNWTFTFETELAEDNNTITAKATDAAGNESDASAGLVIHIDTIAPDAPATPTLADASNSGSTEDTITDDTTPTVEGLAEANSFIAIFNGETLVGSGQANGGGEYSITLSEALLDGVHTLRIMAIDLAGNTSELSEGLELTVDTEAPVAPSTPDLDGESDSGASSTDNVTNNVNPTVGGTATAGTFVQVYVDGVEDGDLIFAEDGTWTHTIVNALAEGQRTITAKAFDLAANESQASGGLTVTVDVTAPTANIVDITPDPRNKVVNSIAITFSEAISGFGTDDLDLRLDDGENRIGQGQALTTGNNTNFTLTGTGPITSGQGTFTLTLGADGTAIVDLAGNALTVDATDVWDTDTVAPTITITAVTPDPRNSAVTSITFTASEEIANFSIEDLALTLDGGDNLLTGAQELTTNDNITFTLSNLAGITTANGQYTLSLVAIGSGIEDNSGNPLEEDASESFEVDSIAPDAPTGMALSEGSLTGFSNTRTGETLPTITGTAEANSFVQVLIDGAEAGDPVQADGEGHWTFIVTNALAEGARTITATATDDADNTSNESADFVITIDLTAPNAPTTPDLSGDSDSGDNSTDDRTNDTTPTFEGLAEDGSLVTLYIDGIAVGSDTATGGVYSITLDAPLEDGTYEISATATDGAGNESAASTGAGFVVDTQNAAQAVNGNAFTNDDTPTVSGISEEDATIAVFIDGEPIDTFFADSEGNWSVALPELEDGTYAITMRSTDKAGNVSELSEPFSLTVDTNAPDAPTALDLVTESDSGSDDEDNLTKTALATTTGSAEAFSTVEIFVEGQSVGFAEFDLEDGTTWSFTFGEGDLASGLNNVTAKATDRADNESAASATLQITLDTSAPAAPSTPNLADASDSNLDSDNTTNDNTPTFTGTAEANSIVKIFADGVEVGSGTATGGNYEITISSLENGTYPITATATDAAGNVSELSGNLNVTIDTTAPVAPTVTGDAFTSDTTPTVSGTADEDVLFVQVYVNGVANGDQVAVNNGEWTHNIEGPLDEGAYEITVTGFDLAGNESDSSVVFDLVVDTTAPDAPAALDLAAGSDSGTSSTDNETNTTLATITGTTEANSTVEVFVGGVSVGPATVEGTNWSYTFTANELSEGLNEVSAKATDRAGNESVASADLVIDLDTTNPSAPSTPDLAAGSDTGFVDADNNTNDNTPTFTGTAEADSIVKIFSAGVQVGSGTATGGNYSITVSTLADGTSQITATATDAAGNVSTLSSGLTVTIDTTAPSAPTLTGDNNTNDTTPTVSGTAEANSRVEVFIDGVSDGIVTTNGSGAWTKNLTNHVAGTYAITAKATDPAGNESAASTTFNLTIDTVAPNAPLIDLQAASDTGSSDSDNETSTALATITGTTEAGSTVEVFVGGNSVGPATVDGTTWSFTFTEGELSEGNNTVTAKATDEAGNLSVASVNLVIDLDTTDPAAPSTPDLDAGSDSDINTDNITSDDTPTFTGTAEDGSTVKIFANGNLIGSGTATGGNYSITASEAMEDGTYNITATATDAAGNVSGISAGLANVIIDTTAPSIPVFEVDTNTNDTTPAISGSGEAGTYVQIFVDGVENGDEILIDNEGHWSTNIVGPLAEGTFAITVVGIDEAGNSSEVSDPVNVTIDLTAPDAPTLLALEATEESDTGLLEDLLTSNTSPTITGTAPVGTNVQLYVEGVANGEPVAVNENGIWTATVVGELAEGDNTITATAFDEAGNESASSAALVVEIDTIAPDAPGTPDLIDASDSGSSDTDNYTNDTTPTFTGTGTNGTLVTLFAHGEAIGSGMVVDGTYTITVNEALGNGSHGITAKATDDAGNVSDASAALNVITDTTASAAPSIDGDSNTNDTTPTVTGTAANSATLVQVYVDGVANGNPVAVVNGAWSHVVEGLLAEGTFAVTATAIDLAGNEGAASDPLSITIDLTAPAAPTNIELDGDSTNGINDSFTNTATPTIVGDFAEGTVSVEIFIDGESAGFAGLGEGSWSFNFEGGLEEGTYTITAKATDEAGNESGASDAFVFTVDVTAPANPAAPDLQADSDSGASSTDDITNDNTPTFTGTIEANGRATLFINGEAFSGENVGGNGVYTFTLTELEDGNYTVTVRSMDQAGNFAESDSQGLSFTIDTTAPSAPTITGDADTNDTTPTVSGTAEAGSTVEVLVDGVSDGTVTADGEGNWSKALTQQTPDIYVITAKATDTAGNQSAASINLPIDIDTTAPAAPTAPDLAADEDSGESSTDNISNADTVVLTGTAEAGSTVTLFSNGEQIDQTTADEEGNYEFEIPVGEENSLTVTFTVTATDAAGNESDASEGLVYVRDVDAPTVEVTPITPDPRETAVDSMTLVFSEEVFNLTLADLTLTRNGGNNLLTDAQTLTTEDGITWTLTGLTALTGTGGVYTLTVLSDTVNDEAGNTVAEDGIESWTFNTAPPTLTTVSNLTGAIKNTEFTITYEDLAAAANEADVDGGDILFKIAAVSTGTLTKDGEPVVPGTTTLAEGEELVWTPANNALGTINAFTIRANDSFDDSATAVQVKVVVEKPTVTLTVVDNEASEADLDTVTFQVERNGSTAAALVVNYSISGQAKNGSDYTTLTGTVTIAAGESTALITTTAINDVIFESAETPSVTGGVPQVGVPEFVGETVILTLKTSSNYTVDGEASTATAIIADNEPTVSIEATDDTATEAGLTTGTFTVTLSEPADQDITVFYTVTDSATSNTDYIKLTGSVVIAAGDTTATITVTPKQDAKVEDDETVTVTLKTNAAYGIDSENNADTVTIEDDEPTVSIEATDDDAGEQGLATGTFTITLSNAVDQDTKVFFKVTGTAKNGTDYTKIDSFVIIAAGDTSATVTITPTQDTTAETDETVTLTLTEKTTYRVDEEDNADTVTIEDNEPTISIEATDDEADEEGLETGTFTVTRDGPDNSQVLRVFYTITGTAKATTDYVKLTGFVDIAAGEDTATITVTPAQDALFEPGETVIVNLKSKTNYRLDDENKSATVTIVDNEPVVSIVANDDVASEAGLTTGQFTFSRTGSTAAALTVFFGVTGTAKSNSDYNSLFSSIVIPAGEESVTLTLTPKTDAITEISETVIVTLKTNSAYGLDDDFKTATVTIFDDLG